MTTENRKKKWRKPGEIYVRDNYLNPEEHDEMPWADVNPYPELKEHVLCLGCGLTYVRQSKFPESLCSECLKIGLRNVVVKRKRVLLFDLLNQLNGKQ